MVRKQPAGKLEGCSDQRVRFPHPDGKMEWCRKQDFGSYKAKSHSDDFDVVVVM